MHVARSSYPDTLLRSPTTNGIIHYGKDRAHICSSETESMTMNDLGKSIRLCLQVALLGVITPGVRGITCKWDSQSIVIKFIYDGSYTEEEYELCEDVATELMASFPEHRVSMERVAIPLPDSLREEFLYSWVYIRREGETGTHAK